MAKLDLTPDELSAAAQTCRIAAHQSDQDAEKQSNPTTRADFKVSAKRVLAETLEAIRRAATSSSQMAGHLR
jgi:hypothetical protein